MISSSPPISVAPNVDDQPPYDSGQTKNWVRCIGRLVIPISVSINQNAALSDGFIPQSIAKSWIKFGTMTFPCAVHAY